MNKLLLEIGVEELPSAYMKGIIKQLETSVSEKLNKARINFGGVYVYATPRRLVVYIENLASKQADAIINNRGPKKSIAFDDKGEPTKATLGFARGQGVEVQDLVLKDFQGVEYIFASKTELGDKTVNILPTLCYDIIEGLVFPKSMRWGDYAFRFARPIRWILALFNDELIKFDLENLVSSNVTYGHRFLSGKLEVMNIENYFTVLADNYVVLDQHKRKELIRKQINLVAAELDAVPMDNEDLLEEITYLVEYPTAFYGEFSATYLAVPKEVLTTSMIAHQRYFPLFDKEGELINKFIGVSNGTAENIEVIRAGNERVLKARLEDALFFWQEDTKVDLANMALKLGDVLHHEKLGTVLDKVNRIERLALYLGAKYNLSNKELVSRAASLCKADLVSNMVYEFPELQGIMGRYYALNNKEDEEVARAILEHYLPRFAGDALPVTDTGNLLSIAEKVDNIIAAFAIGLKPTGSNDPYALRRQAIGLVHILWENNINILLPDLLKFAYQGLTNIDTTNDLDTTVADVYDFILQRLRGVMLDNDVSYDVIDAILAVPINNINEAFNKAKILTDFKNAPSFEDFMVVFNRSNNLTKKWDKAVFDSNLLLDDTEILLYAAFNNIQDEVTNLFAISNYLGGLELIASLREKLDEFFDKVMVMVDDEDLKAARLGLLKGIANLCFLFADFNKII